MLIKAFWTAVSTYSALPVPQYEWDEDATKYSLCFFPAVGLLCAAAQGLWLAACHALGAGAVLYGAAAAALPLLVTGGIHMDGYMDTVDALASWQPRERKLEIMKDSHCGSFAVIYCGACLLVSFGVYAELYSRGLVLPALGGPVLARALSGLYAVNLPLARKNGMLASFTANTQRRSTTIVLLLAAAAAVAGMLALDPAAGAGGALLAVLWGGCCRRLVMKQFGGVTGDTAGFFLVVCELAVGCGVLAGGLLA